MAASLPDLNKAMKILYIGGGYVGTCSAAVSADSGHEVLVYDNDKEKIKKLSSGDKDIIESCLFEEGLGELIIRNAQRLRFSSDYSDVEQFVDEAQAIFMCLPTPEKDETGEADLTFYNTACQELAESLAKRNKGQQSNYVLIINKSTVPIEMADRTKEILDRQGVKNYGIGANPEFLTQGKAIERSIRPYRIVVGAWQEKDFIIFRDIYKRFYDSPNVSYIEVNPIEAAAGKLLANYTLFKRLANCFDIIGRTCERFSNMHYENVRKIITTDKRIGDWGFYNSLFAGGSCLIKDARSLAYQLREKDANADLIIHTLEANRRQLYNFLTRPEQELGYEWSDKKVGFLGAAFKRTTNDIRNSAALDITEFLFKKSVENIKVYDPVAGRNYLNYFSQHPKHTKLELVDKEEMAIDGVDVLLIIADWPQFRELAEIIKERLPKGALIMDGRRMLQHKYQELSEAGYTIIAVGSPLTTSRDI